MPPGVHLFASVRAKKILSLLPPRQIAILTL